MLLVYVAGVCNFAFNEQKRRGKRDDFQYLTGWKVAYPSPLVID